MENLTQEKTQTMLQSDKHWVEELFPPSFKLTVDEFLKGHSMRPTDESSKDKNSTEPEQDDRDSKPSIFRQLAHQQVSQLDIDKIKNVYERVWLMSRLEEEEKKRQAEEEDVDSETDSSGVLVGGVRPQRKAKKVRMKSVATSTNDMNEGAPLNIQDESLWNSNEIEVLRSVYKAAKEQNLRLQVQLRESQYHSQQLEEKIKTQEHVIESKTKHLKEATKANERLSILTKNLKLQLDEATSLIIQLKAQVKSMQQQRSEMLRETHELRVAIDRERLDRKKVELALQHQTEEAFREERSNQANLKALHDEDIQFLQKTIDELTDELNKERKDHERTKRGLQHLRQHFSSLPTQTTGASGNSVNKDELKQWTY